MCVVATYFAELASMLPAQQVVIGSRAICFVRVDDEQSLSMALCALQMTGADATGLAVRLCQLYDRHREVLVYVAEGALRVGLPHEVLVAEEPMALFLARNFSMQKLHELGQQAGQVYAATQSAEASQRCQDIWAAVMLAA